MLTIKNRKEFLLWSFTSIALILFLLTLVVMSDLFKKSILTYLFEHEILAILSLVSIFACALFLIYWLAAMSYYWLVHEGFSIDFDGSVRLWKRGSRYSILNISDIDVNNNGLVVKTRLPMIKAIVFPSTFFDNAIYNQFISEIRKFKNDIRIGKKLPGQLTGK